MQDRFEQSDIPQTMPMEVAPNLAPVDIDDMTVVERLVRIESTLNIT